MNTFGKKIFSQNFFFQREKLLKIEMMKNMEKKMKYKYKKFVYGVNLKKVLNYEKKRKNCSAFYPKAKVFRFFEIDSNLIILEIQEL